jgi:hypothetical protein
VGIGVKSIVVALVAGFCLMSLSPAAANRSLDALITEDPLVHAQKLHTSCHLQVKRVCPFAGYRDCRKVTALICQVE